MGATSSVKSSSIGFPTPLLRRGNSDVSRSGDLHADTLHSSRSNGSRGVMSTSLPQHSTDISSAVMPAAIGVPVSRRRSSHAPVTAAASSILTPQQLQHRADCMHTESMMLVASAPRSIAPTAKALPGTYAVRVAANAAIAQSLAQQPHGVSVKSRAKPAATTVERTSDAPTASKETSPIVHSSGPSQLIQSGGSGRRSGRGSEPAAAVNQSNALPITATSGSKGTAAPVAGRRASANRTKTAAATTSGRLRMDEVTASPSAPVNFPSVVPENASLTNSVPQAEQSALPDVYVPEYGAQPVRAIIDPIKPGPAHIVEASASDTSRVRMDTADQECTDASAEAHPDTLPMRLGHDRAMSPVIERDVTTVSLAHEQDITAARDIRVDSRPSVNETREAIAVQEDQLLSSVSDTAQLQLQVADSCAHNASDYRSIPEQNGGHSVGMTRMTEDSIATMDGLAENVNPEDYSSEYHQPVMHDLLDGRSVRDADGDEDDNDDDEWACLLYTSDAADE